MAPRSGGGAGPEGYPAVAEKQEAVGRAVRERLMCGDAEAAGVIKLAERVRFLGGFAR
jgi:hypothetical protein